MRAHSSLAASATGAVQAAATLPLGLPGCFSLSPACSWSVSTVAAAPYNALLWRTRVVWHLQMSFLLCEDD
uniref:Uncharacterized protein n=1 Tax=Arundo donax TaxID=35708 RepID=A0A0A9FQ92_ARUDO